MCPSHAKKISSLFPNSVLQIMFQSNSYLSCFLSRNFIPGQFYFRDRIKMVSMNALSLTSVCLINNKTHVHRLAPSLGHPAFLILKHIVSSNHLGVSSPLSSNYPCNACLYNKSHKQSFFQIYHSFH